MSTTRELLRRRMLRKDGVVKSYSVAEVAEHTKPHDAWVIIAGKVYNISGFNNHPGGFDVLEQCAGKDVTDAFSVNHPETVVDQMTTYYLGDVEDAKEPSAVIRDFHELDQEFKSSGLYKTEYSFYVKQMVWLSFLFSLVLIPFTIAEQNIYTITLSACALGIFWQQWAFIGHDIGHNAIFHDRAFGDYIGSLVVIVFFGVSGQWWKRNHNVHHIVTNSIQGDPDIQYLPLFAVDSRMIKGFYSIYHKTRFVFDAAARYLVSMQHILYIPVMALARHNLYLQSWIFALTGRGVRNRAVEVACLLVYALWLAELTLRVEEGFGLYWWFLSHAVCGILHVQITLSHFSMECFENAAGTIHRSADDDFVKHQLATSLDVDCSTWMDWFHGGLQYQVVHHLWPQIPRHNTRLVRDKFLIPLCEKHGLTYNSLPFFEAIAKTLTHMKQQANVAWKTEPGSSMMVQAMNLEG
eukprot:TRINITY_DN3782_c1_g1_i1.p1 TRINITY_DN3782_c1_g1~~TRINITY_DN3782_c1_g1_i1.p1  ORF type:complete len:466 (+),score=82.72 TRINITY_DN3782_c1_g1_i1:41-1438(+)